MIQLLDHGYVKLIETWGSDERIIESARMSTQKGFKGWGPISCPGCKDSLIPGTIFRKLNIDDGMGSEIECESCKGRGEISGDEKLLAYLYKHRHTTPFEMAGMIIEVQAPILVFRQWHRHRTQSYNELSARYTELPDVFYIPSAERIFKSSQASSNRQASGKGELQKNPENLRHWIRIASEESYRTYKNLLAAGVSPELARCVLPVNIYSRMRASANLHNWLHFLTLRMDEHAQWETRQYANVIGEFVAQHFPHTWSLFVEGKG